MLLNKHQEGIRLKSGAVPAAVNSNNIFATHATDPIASGWEGRKK